MSKPFRVLFVCSANQHRSPTAARLFSACDGLDCYSAGTRIVHGEAGRHQVNLVDVECADLVFVMESSHRDQLRKAFGKEFDAKIVRLGIEDIYDAGSPQLVDELLRRVPQHLPIPVDTGALRSSFSFSLTSSCW